MVRTCPKFYVFIVKQTKTTLIVGQGRIQREFQGKGSVCGEESWGGGGGGGGFNQTLLRNNIPFSWEILDVL